MKTKILTLTFLLFGILFIARGQYAEYMKKIGESSNVSYVMSVDNDGNLYYVNIENHYLDLMKYDVTQDIVIKISDDFVDDHLDNGNV